MSENIQGCLTDEAIQSLQQRNAQRAQSTIQRMGKSYLLHPSRRVQRLAVPQQDRSQVLATALH